MSRRIMLGKLSDGTYGLRIAQPGCDAGALPVNPDNLIFDSSWPVMLPIYQKGNFSTVQGQIQSINFPSLGYIPLFQAFLLPQTYPNSNTAYQNSYNIGNFFSTYNTSNQPYLDVWVTQNSLTVQYGYSNTNWGTNQWPNGWQCFYIIYSVGGKST